jgi:hypothetical protein
VIHLAIKFIKNRSYSHYIFRSVSKTQTLYKLRIALESSSSYGIMCSRSGPVSRSRSRYRSVSRFGSGVWYRKY